MIDDIDHIESQNKGLQVQTSNQRALLAELDHMLVCFPLYYWSHLKPAKGYIQHS